MKTNVCFCVWKASDANMEYIINIVLSIIIIIVIIIIIIIICCFRSDLKEAHTRRLQRIRGGDKVIRGAHDFVYICM